MSNIQTQNLNAILNLFYFTGMLSASYCLDVTYSQGGGNLDIESWFVKVPLSSKTFLLDEIEVFMYEKMLPMLQAFGCKARITLLSGFQCYNLATLQIFES